MILNFITFLIINFVTLGIGNLFMNINGGSNSDWYLMMNKAPWTPDGWVFGFAWSFLMICFAIYMAYAWKNVQNKKNLMIEYGTQIVLNILWTPLFFTLHYITPALINLILLTALIVYIAIKNLKQIKWATIFIIPYFAWLLVANSLNAYAVLFN